MRRIIADAIINNSVIPAPVFTGAGIGGHPKDAAIAAALSGAATLDMLRICGYPPMSALSKVRPVGRGDSRALRRENDDGGRAGMTVTFVVILAPPSSPRHSRAIARESPLDDVGDFIWPAAVKDATSVKMAQVLPGFARQNRLWIPARGRE